jgi:colicin import membrane protein
MRFRKNVDAAEDAGNRILKPFIVSFTGHMILFGVILFNPEWRRQPDEFFPSVIDVHMVDLTDAGGALAKKTEVMDKAPIEKEAQEEEAAEAETPAPETEVKPEISVSKSKPRPKKKTALKYKTFKSKKVLKSALDKLEKQMEKTPPRPLEDALKRLREDVAEKEKSTKSVADSADEGDGKGKSGPSATGSKKQTEIANLYMWEVAMEVQKNWAFAEQLSRESRNLMARLEFKVMPNGEIKDIHFTDRSGNAYLDESAYKAIIKANPVRPHPKELALPYVHFGLNFTPKGVQ